MVVTMNKPNVASDYTKLKELLVEYSKHLVALEKENKKLKKSADKLVIAEETLKEVQDLINSNEEIVHFYTAKKEFNKPIDLYFRGTKK